MCSGRYGFAEALRHAFQLPAHVAPCGLPDRRRGGRSLAHNRAPERLISGGRRYSPCRHSSACPLLLPEYMLSCQEGAGTEAEAVTHVCRALALATSSRTIKPAPQIIGNRPFSINLTAPAIIPSPRLCRCVHQRGKMVDRPEGYRQSPERFLAPEAGHRQALNLRPRLSAL